MTSSTIGEYCEYLAAGQTSFTNNRKVYRCEIEGDGNNSTTVTSTTTVTTSTPKENILPSSTLSGFLTPFSPSICTIYTKGGSLSEMPVEVGSGPVLLKEGYDAVAFQRVPSENVYNQKGVYKGSGCASGFVPYLGPRGPTGGSIMQGQGQGIPPGTSNVLSSLFNKRSGSGLWSGLTVSGITGTPAGDNTENGLQLTCDECALRYYD